MIGKAIAAAALTGSLLCLGFGGAAGQMTEGAKTQPEPASKGGKVVGILTHFEYNWTKANGPKPDTRLSLKAEGEKESVDYLLALPNESVDPKLEQALRKVFPSNTASVQWEMRDGKRVVTKVEVLTPTKGQGVKRGTIVAREAGFVDLKGDSRGDLTVRYVVPWDPKAKGPNPTLAAALQKLNIGDKVDVGWSANPERVWVNQVKLASPAPTK